MGSTYYVGDYCRFSSKEDDSKAESNSIINQRLFNEQFIEELSQKYPEDIFIHVDTYSDDDWTGTNFNRPDFKRLERDCRSGKVNCIVVKDHSRFGRNAAKMTTILQSELEGVRYISKLDNFDSKFDDYDAMFQIKNAVNQMYAEDISNKVHGSIDAKQKKGEFIGSFCCYGYVKCKANKNKLEIDENVRDVVEMIFNMRLQGMNLQTIARKLNELGIPAPSTYKKMQGLNYNNHNSQMYEGTQLWTFSTLHRMLTNETYMGNLVQGRCRQRMRGKQKQKPKSEWVVVKGAVPAIVSPEVFYEVQRLLKEANHIKSSPENDVHIFAGIIKCGECGRSLIKSQKRKNEALYYACRRRKAQGKQYCDNDYIRADVLEKIILDDLNSIIEEVKDINSLIDVDSVDTKKVTLQNQIDRIKQNIAKLGDRRRRTYLDYQDGLVSKQDYLITKEETEKQEESLQNQLKKIQETLNNYSVNSKPNAFIQKLLETQRIDVLDRQTVLEMIETIYIYKDNRIKIIYKFANEVEALKQTLYDVA